jgi:polyribonucleotide nucleotidyltransferase
VIEVGRVARQVSGAALLSSGRTVMLVSAVSRDEPTPGLDFFPLTVEYREKLAGAGRIPGGFLRREARAASHEILASRLVDRTIRPFFPDGFRCETQLLATVMSYDPDGDPEALAITGASAALMISEIPWTGPVAGVRVARIDGALQLFPTRKERLASDLDLVVSVSRDGLVMVEGACHEVPEEELLEALDQAKVGAEPLLDLQDEMRAAVGVEKRAFRPPQIDSAALDRAAAIVRARGEELFAAEGKEARRAVRAELTREIVAAFETAESAAETPGPAVETTAPAAVEASSAAPGLGPEQIAERVLRDEIRRRTLGGRRLDGRGADEVRPISGEVAWLPGAHGSSIFTRGETQALVTCTLGTARDMQLIEGLGGVSRESFLLHYNFPPYAVGEARPLRGPSRRDVGHGNLALRALRPLLPEFDDFPVTLRVESEISSSNGSSSMATVCGASLALMDAAVPLRRPVAGVAMGLIVEGEQSIVLTDILGDEDHLGDMDFKVAGTERGVTAVQLDNKIGSLPREMLARALGQAERARAHILGCMREICASPRATVPPQAPQVSFLQIRPPRIRDLIGPGGRHIQSLQDETGVKVDVEDDGRVRIYAEPGAKLREAVGRIRHLTGEPEVGRIYRGRVTGLPDFGCFVELFQGIEGLVHISELGRERIEHPSQVAAMGEEILVKVTGVSNDGKIQLSHRAALGADPSEIEE